MKLPSSADWPKAMRVFLLVVLPFVVGAALLPHTESMQSSPLLTPAEIQTSYLRTVEYQFTHEITPMQSQLPVSSVFPLANYVRFWPAVSYGDFQLCFEDTGSFVTYADGTNVAPNFEWSIKVNNLTTLRVPANSISCAGVNANESYSFVWVADLPPSVLSSAADSNVTFTPKMVVYPTVVMDYGILQGIAFIPVFYLLIFYPVAGIVKKIGKGLLEQ